MNKDVHHYRIHLTPLPDKSDQTGIRRLRALLKAALRSYRLRCTYAVEAEPEHARPWPEAEKEKSKS